MMYSVILEKDPEGGYTAEVPSLPGCITHGRDIDEALLMTKEAIEGYIETLRDLGKEIPADRGILIGTVEVNVEAAICHPQEAISRP